MIPYETNSFGSNFKPSRNATVIGLLVLGLLALVLAVLLVGVVLLLPPVSLLTRLDPDYVSIGESGGDVQDPDGLILTFPREGMAGPVRVKLTSIPRSLFLEGETEARLQAAAGTIPPNLVIKSPFYRIQYHGPMPREVVFNVPIPNEAEPYRTLDLYTWNGTGWEWLPSRLIEAEAMIEAKLNYLPQSLVVMQTQTARPKVSSTYSEGDLLPGVLSESSFEINPMGLFLEADGLIPGRATPLSPEFQAVASAVVPIIRNWHADGTVRSDLIDNLLISAEARDLHINVILNLVQTNGYDGIGLDYRDINPELRREYTVFLEQLRAALPPDKQLLVYVAPPVQISPDTWESGAYDWQAIGRLADAVLLPVLLEPGAYEPGGQMESLLNWAVGQINRYKLLLYLSTHSVEQSGEASISISYQQALQTLGTVGIVGGASTVSPGQVVDFTLSGLAPSTGVQFNSTSGLYSFTYLDGQTLRTVYVENAASLARKLRLVVEYNLRGVAVQHLFQPDNDPLSFSVLHQFINLFIPPVEGHHAVIWRVADPGGGLIAEQVVDITSPGFQWTAPAAAGTYQIIASISPDGDPAKATPLGSVQVTVAAP